MAVLAMVFLCLSAASLAGIAGSGSAVQQGEQTALLQSLCGHDQPQLACHAPDACCRPDQALPPPDTSLFEPAFGRVAAVVYGAMPAVRAGRAPENGFRQRAPPV
jgi:hypothetical protein